MIDPRIQAALNEARERATRVVTANGGISVQIPTSTQTIAKPITEAEVFALITSLLPRVLDGIAQARAALGDRKLSLAEALQLGTTIATLVSAAVKDGAPLVKGADARLLASALLGALYDVFIPERLPTWARPFNGAIKSAVLGGLELVYQALVKKK
ncbi:hypothetical protein [Deinococcus sedimenti]|uniref:DUF697 domain-containing protein n=1 Tax=Deinococcus sedimenti TaxID=1867090 RepID=A0ABQ2S266_9DEIO|nr:hypothetical protein [Deinococcus sedimenti]GGR84665.1 hypothetical protein GCM10008960_09620 [Deinococcus sedimenti]